MNDMFCYILDDMRRVQEKTERRFMCLVVATAAYVVYTRINQRKQKDKIAELTKENEELKNLKGE